MKLKISFLIFSLIISQNIYAQSFKNNFSLKWGQGKVINSPFHSELTTSVKNDQNFIVMDIKKLKLNFTKHNFYLNFRIGQLSHMTGIELRFMEKENQDNYYSYTIPYFTDYEFNPIKPYTWKKYGISGANLKLTGKAPSNINYLGIYISNKLAPFSFGLKNIWKSTKIHPGVVTISFDDGYKSQLIAAKILQKQNLKATAFIMPRSKAEDLLSLKDLKLMFSQGWDIQSHHKYPITWMDKTELEKELKFGLNYIKRQKLNSKTNHFAYPLGKQTPGDIHNTIKNHFNTARIAGGGIETLPPAEMHLIRTYNVLNTTTIKELKEVILNTKKNKQWLVLMFHYIKEKADHSLDFTPKKFEEFSIFLNKSKINVMTMDEVYRKYLK